MTPLKDLKTALDKAAKASDEAYEKDDGNFGKDLYKADVAYEKACYAYLKRLKEEV